MTVMPSSVQLSLSPGVHVFTLRSHNGRHARLNMLLLFFCLVSYFEPTVSPLSLRIVAEKLLRTFWE